MVDRESEGLYNVTLDDNNLRAGVQDGGGLELTVNKDIKLQQWEAEIWLAGVGRWWEKREIVDGSAVRRWLQICHGYHLVLIGLYTAYLELFCDIFANSVAGCEDVSRHGERKLALHKVVFEFQDELLVFGVAVVLVLHIGSSGARAGGRGQGWWWRCRELQSLAVLLLLGGENLEDVVREVLILVFIGSGGFSNLEDVRFDYLLYLTGQGVAQVEMQWYFTGKNCARLCGSRGGLGSQPCINTHLKSVSHSIEGNWLPVGEVNPVVDPGGTTGLDVVVEGGA